MRKVHSLDCVRLHSLEFKGGWTKPSSTREPTSHFSMDKASRFSRFTAGEKGYVI